MAEPATQAGGVRARRRDERRRCLIRAARELLEMADATGFSMPDLAARAGVSLATPYNIFGSKAAILQAVFAADVAGLHRSLAAGDPSDPIAGLLGTADLLAATFARRPRYYRALARSLGELGTSEMQRLIVPLGDSLLTPVVLAIERQALLRSPVPAAAVARQLARIFDSAFGHWSAFDLSEASLAGELKLGMGLVLLGVVAEPARQQLNEALLHLPRLPADDFGL